MTANAELFVRSHVGRDLLQCAQGFQNERVVVWEYVTNGFEYVDPGVKPIVKVFLDSARKRIVVQDNGRGMSWDGDDGLQNFFLMHGQNVDRKKGRRVRGQFGTGKSAAFGIADVLRITTIRNGLRCQVELSRQDVGQMSSSDPVPVKVLEKNKRTDEPNGTKVEIEGIHLRTLDLEGTKALIERHLARLPKNISIFVNKQECQYIDPPYSIEKVFNSSGAQCEVLGDVSLTVRVAKAPLEEDLRGIAVLSHGNWHATTLAGSEGREFSQSIFGFVDIPALEEDESEIRPFDMSRSMRLNPNNRVVQHALAFISHGIETVRKELLEEDRKRRQTEEAKRLDKEGRKIADILNKDFEAFRQMLAKARAKARGGVDVHDLSLEGGEDDQDLVYGGEEAAEVVDDRGSPGGSGNGGGDGDRMPTANPSVDAPDKDKDEGEPLARRAGGERGAAKPRGGFSVQFKSSGKENHRAFYQRDDRVIVINLDHPQIAAAKGTGTAESPPFRRLAYEVAFAEYAIALQRELVARHEYLEMDEPLSQARETLNRLARNAASLYAED
jgi:hypothetical protein